jgi:chromosome segregation ATPase
MAEMSSFKARLILDDLEREVGAKMNFLRRFADEMDAIDAALAEKKRELEGTQRELAVACGDLGRAQSKHEALEKGIKKWTKQLEGTGA